MGWWNPLASYTFGLSLMTLLLATSAREPRDSVQQPDIACPWPDVRRHARSYHHLEGDVRWRRLYSSNHFFLRIGGDGKVEGTRRKESLNSIVEIRSVQVGTVAIRSIHSGFYLAMNRRGKVYGTKAYSPNCKFKERIEENGYNTYASFHWHHEGQPMFLSLNSKGLPRRGTKTRWHHLSTHFLPMLVS
ncbi:fibroblast growth factor 22 [Python bivittatus]|uniref:Fibroblast growth factor n=1 Tax=Python bivittatus TaxID=176946 RepID=A0A9F2WDS9_PYTBI|nr:fibroblast growth factor 22 [Python bivittatus]